MKSTRIIVLGIALVSGAIAAFLALNLTTPAPVETASVIEVEAPANEVLVANQDISIGTTLSPDMMEWREWPETGLSERFVLRTANPEAVEETAGAIARASFFEGEPISDGKLIRSDSGFLSAILPAGKVAIATTIAAETSAGGFILPNDRVDVIMTRQSEAANGSSVEYVTETILNNIRVLAIDQTIEDQDGEQVVIGQTATLELTSDQAQILTVAQQIGDRLTLALRSIADSSDSAEVGPDATHLIGGARQDGAVTVVKSGIARDVDGMR